MPSYDYKCTSCKHIFEVTKSMSDPHPTECPACKCGPIDRHYGQLEHTVIYKGKGWYKTDGKY